MFDLIIVLFVVILMAPEISDIIGYLVKDENV